LEETGAQPETAAPAETVVAETSTRHQVDSVAREAQVDLAALADPRAIAMATAEPLATAERLVTVAMATPEFPVPRQVLSARLAMAATAATAERDSLRPPWASRAETEAMADPVEMRVAAAQGTVETLVRAVLDTAA
jgi:hypothetical protein